MAEAAVAGGDHPPGSDERMIILAARHIVERVKARGYRVILAGVGHGFFAARLARRWLAEAGLDIPVMVETGLYDLDVGPGADSFLLSHENLSRATRHSDAEDVLGMLTCGADNQCLGVVGAAQVDRRGRLNSTRLADGRPLVGSGGASDIAAGAAELVVLITCDRGRLVPEVDYVTSPGGRVNAIATDRCVLMRGDDRASWRVVHHYPLAGVGLESCVADVVERCGFPVDANGATFAPAISSFEHAALAALDPENRYCRNG
jgi:hypothetical protein